MYESPGHRSANRTSALHVWLRLTLAAFVMAVYAALALASGVAHADEGPSGSGGESKTTSAASSPQSGTTSPGTGATSDAASSPTRPSGVGRAPRHVGGPARTAPDADTSASAGTSPSHVPDRSTASSTDTPKVTGANGTSGATDPTASEPQHTGTSGPQTTPPTGAGDATAAVEATEVVAAPVTPLQVVPHNAKRSAQLASAAAPVAEPSSVPVAPTVRSLSSTVASAPATATLAAVTPSSPVPTIQPRLDLQVAGLVADVGTVTVSAIHTVASTVAQTFGPTSFFGVPYLLASTVANAAAAVGGSLVGASQFAPPSGRFAVTYGILDGLAFLNPTKPPAGANDPSIFVTPEHPLPIILINGTTATQGANWSVGAPVLANAGYKVYTFNYGNTTADPNYPIQAIGDIRQSALELSAEVDMVIAKTGAPKVILIGHSQGGGILPEYYINNLGGAAKVSQLIGISPSNHGTDLDGLIALQSLPVLGPLAVGIANAIGPALYQQALGSPFQQEVYGNGDTRPGVLYTTIASINDEVVTPYTQQALTGPNVTNIVLQDRYPGLVVGHANIITSPAALALVLEALADNEAANPLANQNVVAA